MKFILNVFFIGALVFSHSSCTTSVERELTLEGTRNYWEGATYCKNYFDDFFRLDLDSLRKLNNVEDLSRWKSENPASKLGFLIDEVRKASPQSDSMMTVDQRYDQINLIILKKISKVKGFSEQKCDVLTLNLFREHLYSSLGGEDSAVIEDIRKSGVQDDFRIQKVLLIALTKPSRDN